MRIYTKCRLRFLKPGVNLLTAPEKPTGGSGNVQLVTKQRDFTEAFFETEPGTFQDVPDWVRDERIFQMALADGDAIIVESPSVGVVPGPSGGSSVVPGEPLIGSPVTPTPEEEAAKSADFAALDSAQKAQQADSVAAQRQATTQQQQTAAAKSKGK